MVLELKVENNKVINEVSFEYSIVMNEINKAIINLEGSTAFQNNLLTLGKSIKILNDGVLEFEGRINSRSNLEGNAIKLVVSGNEEEYVKDNIEPSLLSGNGVYVNTPSEDIFEELIGNGGVVYSAGTIDTGINIDQKFRDSSSWWNGILNLLSKTGQEKEVNYSTKKINISNSLGTAKVDTLNEGTDFTTIVFQESEPTAKKVLVYGKGDGEIQIKATATSGGFIKGTHNVKSIRDPTIISESEAQIRADAELSQLEENIETYIVPVNNPFKTYQIGDTITINAKSYSINNKLVRIVKVTRGMRGKHQFLQIEVTNANHSKTFKNATQRINDVALKSQDEQTYMQGSGNTLTFGGQINAHSSAPLIVPFNLPDKFIKDEANNIRVNSFTLDYDIDKFRQSAGDAQYIGGDIGVDGSSGDSDVDTEFDFNVWVESGGGNDNKNLGLGFVSGNTDFSIFSIFLNVPFKLSSNSGYRIEINNTSLGVEYFDESGLCNQYGQYSASFMIKGDIEGDTINVEVTDNSGTSDTYSYGLSVSQMAEHDHTAGTYEIDGNSIDNIVIGDNVSDALDVDSTGISWDLQFFNGSAWVTKNSDSETFPAGRTFNSDIDLSNGGTYPDASGDWRIRLFPNVASSSADLAKAVINVKHNLDN